MCSMGLDIDWCFMACNFHELLSIHVIVYILEKS